MVMWYWSADTLFCQLSIGHNMVAGSQTCYKKCDICSWISFPVVRADGRTDERPGGLMVTWPRNEFRSRARVINRCQSTKKDELVFFWPIRPTLCLFRFRLKYLSSWAQKVTEILKTHAPSSSACLINSQLVCFLLFRFYTLICFFRLQ